LRETARPFRKLVALLALFGLSGCSGRQSALDPAGKHADELASLFWIMLVSTGVIWLLVIFAAFTAVKFQPQAFRWLRPGMFILLCGVILPTISLGGLLIYALQLLPGARTSAAEMTVKVSGEQWWWRVQYQGPEGKHIDSANEIRIPVEASVYFELTSPDVIHSFWIPALGGKLDMIPGRTNRLHLIPTKPGTYRGVCAEYCGTAHALMAFPVIVQTQSEFDLWLKLEASDAVRPGSPSAVKGENMFMETGCTACHTIRGTQARGEIGPDLTHFGTRQSIGAGILPNTSENLEKWLRETGKLKPAVRMPEFGMLDQSEIGDLAVYLTGLK